MGLLKKWYRKIFPASKKQVATMQIEIIGILHDMAKSNAEMQEFVRKDLVNENKMLYAQVQELRQEVTDIKADLKKLDSVEQNIGQGIVAEQEKVKDILHVMNGQLEHKFQDTNNRIIDVRERFISAKIREKLMELDDKVDNQIVYVKNRLEKINKTQAETLGYARENNWGIVFGDTISASEWLTDTNLSLGRWAIGYQCAYVLFRVLDELKPQKILELGLGQSTKIIGQYADKTADVDHIVVESDQSWIDFFNKNYHVSESTHIVSCEYGFTDYKGEGPVRIFSGMGDKIKGKSFDLIMIDAPFSGDMKEYARIDVLLQLPSCINETFVIMIDDAERPGEKRTFEEMKKKLDECGIKFAAGLYHGKKSVGVIVSENIKYVLTM